MSTIKVDKLQGTSGSATALTLNGAASTFNGVHTVGNNAIYTSDGGAVTQNLVQGLAKVWCNFEGDGTVAISDSFNTSGITDNTTGDYKIAINNDMSNATYSVTGSGTHDAGTSTCYLAIDHDVPPTTSTVDVNAMQGSNDTRIDAELLCFTVHGDLA